MSSISIIQHDIVKYILHCYLLRLFTKFQGYLLQKNQLCHFCARGTEKKVLLYKTINIVK